MDYERERRVENYGWKTPVDAIEEFIGEEPLCEDCGERIEESGLFDGCGFYFCHKCARERIEEGMIQEAAFALEHCRLTRDLPEYDPSLEFRCTPEDYEMGNPESYSPNAYHACCRHHYSNYDELIKKLSRYDMYDQIRYDEIRLQITRLIVEKSGIESEDEYF